LSDSLIFLPVVDVVVFVDIGGFVAASPVTVSVVATGVVTDAASVKYTLNFVKAFCKFQSSLQHIRLYE